MIDWRGKIVLDDCLNFTIPLFPTSLSNSGWLFTRGLIQTVVFMQAVGLRDAL